MTIAQLISEKQFSKYGVYAIEIDNKYYIGSTMQSFKKRILSHLRSLKKHKHHSHLLQKAFCDFGEENINFYILETCNSYCNITEREQFYIDFFKPFYNIAPFAKSCRGVIHTQETIDKFRESHKGQKRTQETVDKWRKAVQSRPPTEKELFDRSQLASRKPKIITEETRKRMSESAKHRPPASNDSRKQKSDFFKSLKRTDEWKKNISIGLRRYAEMRKQNDNCSIDINM